MNDTRSATGTTTTPRKVLDGPVHRENVPQCLRELNQWVNYDPTTKKPSPKITGRLLSFEYALEQDARHVGFVFTEGDPYAGIDLDARTELSEALLIESRHGGLYVERSPSGRGFHIIGRGALLKAITKGTVDEGVEAYSQGRYFTVTGHGEGDANRSLQWALDDIWRHRVSAAHERDAASADALPERYDGAVHGPMLQPIPADDYAIWTTVGMALHSGGAPFQVWHDWSQNSHNYANEPDCWQHWDSFKVQPGGVTLGRLRQLARDHGWKDVTAEDFPVVTEEQLDAEAPPNPWGAALVLGDTLTHEPPVRVWGWDQWMPRGVVTGLSGPPGVAKSTLAMQLCVHHCLGVPFAGQAMATGPALFITVEDDAHELHRRYRNICSGLMAGPEEVPGMGLIAATDMATMLVATDKDGKTQRTQLFRQLVQTIKQHGAKLVVLDLVGDFWDGNEISRAEVSAYVRQHLGQLAQRLDISLLVISHLNKAGEVSGSTAWLGSYRSALTLTRADGAPDVLELIRVKANYAPPMTDPVLMRWVNGYVDTLPEDVIATTHEQDMRAWVAMLPRDEWLRRDAHVRPAWEADLAVKTVTRRLHQLVAAQMLETRTRARTTEWRVL